MKYHFREEEEASQIKLNNNNFVKKQEDNEFYVPKPEKLSSEVDKKQQKLIAEEKEKYLKSLEINDDEHERDPSDEFAGRRVHFWLLILAHEKNPSKSIFLDPVSSNQWGLDAPNLPFFKISQIFDHTNIWVNLKPDCPISGLDLENFQQSPHWTPVISSQEEEIEADPGKFEKDGFSPEDLKAE